MERRGGSWIPYSSTRVTSFCKRVYWNHSDCIRVGVKLLVTVFKHTIKHVYLTSGYTSSSKIPSIKYMPRSFEMKDIQRKQTTWLHRQSTSIISALHELAVHKKRPENHLQASSVGGRIRTRSRFECIVFMFEMTININAMHTLHGVYDNSNIIIRYSTL